VAALQRRSGVRRWFIRPKSITGAEQVSHHAGAAATGDDPGVHRIGIGKQGLGVLVGLRERNAIEDLDPAAASGDLVR